MIIESYKEKIRELSTDKQLLLGLCYVDRHRQIVREFDDFYGESISEQFIKTLDNIFSILLCKSSVSSDIQKCLMELEKIIPDSDDYPDIKCPLTQNAIIMLIYCYKFLLESQTESIFSSLYILDDTIDVRNYEKNNNYDSNSQCKNELDILDDYYKIINTNQVIDGKFITLLREKNSKNMY